VGGWTQALKYQSQETNVSDSDNISDKDVNVIEVTGNPLQMSLIVNKTFKKIISLRIH
jgi:hypothetical protein